MCGIFGHSYQRKAKVPAGQRETLIASLCVANSYRGAQSWGVYASGQKGKKARVRREVGDIANVSGLAALAAYPVVFGHTRHATTGAVTRENQHPFKVGHILLAHNGMVWNHYLLNSTHRRDCTVDSQHFAHHLAQGLPFTDIEAYGSLEWTDDKRPNTIFLCRMRDGVLSVAGIKNRKGKQVGVVWSSDKDHLRKSLEASRLTYFFYEVSEGVVYEVTAGKMYTTKRPALVLADVKVDALTRRRSRYLTSGGSYGDSWGDDWRTDYPRRGSSRTYTWDSRLQSVVPTSHNYLDKRTSDLSVVGVASSPSSAGEEEEDTLWGAVVNRSGLLREEGSGAPAHREEDASEEEEDYDAEAQRLGLVKVDSWLWSDPETGMPKDRDDIDDILDAEESEGTGIVTESEITEEERKAWDRTTAIALAAVNNTKH